MRDTDPNSLTLEYFDTFDETRDAAEDFVANPIYDEEKRARVAFYLANNFESHIVEIMDIIQSEEK